MKIWIYTYTMNKKVETNRIKRSYLAVAQDGAKIMQEWQFSDAELEDILDEIEYT